ncbi:MAG: A/G-specific adenine glycosylase [Bacteroidales bacterium]
MNQIFERLINWYKISKRDLPWRNTTNPYFIWVSEIILQQTRVEQGLPYYLRFINAFPTIEKLAQAKQQEVLNVWKGLGYYRRAINMHQAAQQVLNDYKGTLPDSYRELLKLKGIGEYTAAAIASIAFGEKTPVVDGNVIRVMSRVFMLHGDQNNKAFKKKLVGIIRPSMQYFNPADVNQSLMELGACVCLPQKPACATCPINSFCKAHKANKVEQFPMITPKTEKKKIYFNYLIINYHNYVLMQLRKENNIWKNMYQFPLIEDNKNLKVNELTEHTYFKKHFSSKMDFLYESKIYKHVLSHRIIYAKYFVFKLKKEKDFSFEKINIQDLDNLPLPRLIEKIKNEAIEVLNSK